ncbi:hypothetical protein V2J09_022448 [Rumex salicifolius]
MEAGSCSQLKTYEIPQKIVEEHGSHLWKYVCFEAANGWKDFIQYYSITSGYTLLLRYEGGFFFQVTIFNSSGLEIEYPVDSASTNQRAVNRNPLRMRKLVMIAQLNLTISSIHSANIECNNEVLQVEGVNTSNERSRVVEQARNFQITNPHFTVAMPPTCLSHLISDLVQEIPESPVISYFYDWKDKGRFLNGPDGRSLLVKCCIKGPPACQVRLNEGWNEFAQKYGLREVHACTFELINATIMLFNVTIDERDTENEQSTRIEPAELMPGPHELNPCNPPSLLSRLCTKSILVHNALVCFQFPPLPAVENFGPYAHASRFLSDQHGKEVFLHGGLAERTWCAKCYSVKHITRILSGWKDFVVDNDLKEGDTCVFELLSQAPNHYKVTILPDPESRKPN